MRESLSYVDVALGQGYPEKVLIPKMSDIHFSLGFS